MFFEFEDKIQVYKIQILSDEFLIASLIEFFIGNEENDNETNSNNYENYNYTRLG
jgi:hypothetical protein